MKRVRGNPEDAVVRARELRRQGTPAEDVLWEFLRDRRFRGCKFRRQHPLGPFIVDFCCPSRRLIIELDGDIHEEQQEQDAARTRHLEAFGYRVLRFDNLDIANRMDHVLETIATTLQTDNSSPLSQDWERGRG